jgi:hypothetical protein
VKEEEGVLCKLQGGGEIRVGVLGFADDLGLLSNGRNQSQIETVRQWERISGNKMRPEKCATTCTKWGKKCQKPHAHEVGEQGEEGVCNCLGAEGLEESRVLLGKRDVPFSNPNEANKYLGVWIAADGSFAAHFAYVMSTTKAKLERARRHKLRPEEAVAMANRWIAPAMLYPAPLAPFTMTQIRQMRALVYKFVTTQIKAIGTADRDYLSAERKEDGLEVVDLEEEYAVANTAAYEKQLNSRLPDLRAFTRANLRHDQKFAPSPEDVLCFQKTTNEQEFRVETAEGGLKKRKGDDRKKSSRQEGARNSRAKRAAAVNHMTKATFEGNATQTADGRH